MTEKIKTIWVPNNSGHDLSKAETLGELNVYQEGPVNVFTGALVGNIKEWLKEAAREDYLMMTGSIPACTVAFGVLLTRFGKVNMLIYHQQEKVYRVRSVSQEELHAERRDEGASRLT